MNAVGNTATGPVRRRFRLARGAPVALIVAASLLLGACGPFSAGEEATADDALAAAAANDPCVLVTREEASDYTNAEMDPGEVNTSPSPPFAYPGQVICTFEGRQRQASRWAGRPTFLHIALTPPGVSEDYARDVLAEGAERAKERGHGGELEELDELPLGDGEVVEVSKLASEVTRGGSAVEVLVDKRILAIRVDMPGEDPDDAEGSAEVGDPLEGERAVRLAALILSRGLAPVGLAEADEDDDSPVDDDQGPADEEPPADAEEPSPDGEESSAPADGEAAPPDGGESPPASAGAEPQPGSAPVAPPGAEAIVPPEGESAPDDEVGTGRAGGDTGG